MLPALLGLLLAVAPASAQQTSNEPRRFALIVVGLPGDADHETLFAEVVADWKQWFVTHGEVDDENVMVLFGRGDDQYQAATQENLRTAVTQIAEQSEPQDSVWIFLLGHGSQDQRRTWFHLPGPDLHEAGWADALAALKNQQQVIWLTQSAGGGLVRALSRPGRIVISATAQSGEINETRFPHALREVLKMQLRELDEDQDGTVSVLELFRKASQAVTDYYEKNNLAPTEHAQLDYNGDGRGSELAELFRTEKAGNETPGDEATSELSLDGQLAAKVKAADVPATTDPQDESSEGTESRSN